MNALYKMLGNIWREIFGHELGGSAAGGYSPALFNFTTECLAPFGIKLEPENGRAVGRRYDRLFPKKNSQITAKKKAI